MKTIMKILTMRLHLLAIAAGFMILFAGCQQEDLPVSQDENLVVKTNETQTRAPNPRASGQGGLIINDRNAHFSFHVSMDSDGNVNGSWETNSPGQNIRTHGNFNCMGVVDNETVFAGGVITQVNPDNPFGAEVGDSIYFKVRDNGEGSNADPDQFSDYFLLGNPLCDDFNVFMQDIEFGNIQVKV